jgi:GH15 family glucan-1,4-alpha-glucosidase
MQIMYGVGGERWLPELCVPWLPRYEHSSPVRIGNGAYEQMQLDVYGEIADAMFQAHEAGMPPSKRAEALRPVILKYVAKAWRAPDEGVWEVRGGPQLFIHSKVMAWVAFDRAAKQLEAAGLSEAHEQARGIAREFWWQCTRSWPRGASCAAPAAWSASSRSCRICVQRS